MGTIHLLPEIVANKIAAGEVVENPASVVKELVENALDAQATKIEVTIQTGGIQLIRVVDNGTGINADDIVLTIKRYATSKITAVEDLDQIATFGFRGEALPSISAVSRFKIISRTPETDTGTELTVTGGVIGEPAPAATAPGTTIEVRDLFFNTPARRKFLRSDRYERSLIADTVTALALAHHDVAFVLKDGGQEVINFPRTTQWLERMKQLFGNEYDNLLPVEEKRGDFHIMGVVSKPSLHRVNKTRQFFFVNNRYVKYPRLAFALEEAYHGYLLPGRHPYAALFIHTQPHAVDVNVHPQKQIVKIAGEKTLQELCYSLVRESLDALFPAHQRGTPVQQPPAPYRANRPLADKTPLNLPHTAAPSISVPSTPTEELFAAAVAQKSASEQTSFQTELLLVHDKPFAITRILGQVQASYIVCETTGGFILIDQHAAHERIVFEELKTGIETQSPAQQMLLFPVVLDLSHEENTVMETALPAIEKYGFSISSLGNTSYSIQAYPTIFRKEHIKDIVMAVIDQFQQESQRKSFNDQLETVAAIMACKSRSIKAHEQLTEVDMLTLISRLARCNDPYHCSHGRPTMVSFDQHEIEKRFGRKE